MGSNLSKVIQRQSWNLPLVTYPHIQTTGKCVLGAGAGTLVSTGLRQIPALLFSSSEALGTPPDSLSLSHYYLS